MESEYGKGQKSFVTYSRAAVSRSLKLLKQERILSLQLAAEGTLTVSLLSCAVVFSELLFYHLAKEEPNTFFASIFFFLPSNFLKNWATILLFAATRITKMTVCSVQLLHFTLILQRLDIPPWNMMVQLVQLALKL